MQLHIARLYEQTQGHALFDMVLSLSRLTKALKHEPYFADGHISFMLYLYGLARWAGALPVNMNPMEWVDILNVAIQVLSRLKPQTLTITRMSSPWYLATPSRLSSPWQDMEASGVNLSSFKKDVVDCILKVSFLKYDTKELEAIMRKLSWEFQIQVRQPELLSPTPTLTSKEQVMNSLSNALSPTLYNPGLELTQPSPTGSLPSSKLFVYLAKLTTF